MLRGEPGWRLMRPARSRVNHFLEDHVLVLGATGVIWVFCFFYAIFGPQGEYETTMKRMSPLRTSVSP